MPKHDKMAKSQKQPNNDFNQQGGDPPMWAERLMEENFAEQAAASNRRKGKQQ